MGFHMTDTTDDVLEREPDAAPEPIPQLGDGVYFDLPEDVYHAQHRLSSSGIQALMASEADFWAGSWMNPDRKDNDTLARQLGRAYHIARLEPHRFPDLYCRELTPEDRPDALDSEGVKVAIKAAVPQKEDRPGLLATDTDVKNTLAAMGHPKSIAGENAADRAERLRNVNPEAVIWSVIKSEWESEFGPMTAPAGESRVDRAKRLVSYGYKGQIYDLEYTIWREAMGEREALPPIYYDQILRDMELIQGNDDVAKHLKGGQSEVSVLWTEEDTGVPMKARIDDLHEWGGNDFKTFDNQQKKPLRRALADAFRYNKYYIQATVYREAMEKIRGGNLNIGGAFTEEQANLIGKIRARALPVGMRYIFQQKGGVPNLVSLELEFYAGLDPSLRAAAAGADPARVEEVRAKYSSGNASAWWRRAKIEIREALRLYITCMEVFGEEKPWSTIYSDGTLGDDDFNSFWLDMKD